VAALASEGLRVEISAALRGPGGSGMSSKRGQAWISETDLTDLAGESTDADCDGFGANEPSGTGPGPRHGHGAACTICAAKSENAHAI